MNAMREASFQATMAPLRGLPMTAMTMALVLVWGAVAVPAQSLSAACADVQDLAGLKACGDTCNACTVL